ncbi:hypothetical protein M3G03_10140 [Aestuariimicrobium sp. p3-SID1156]|uniref:hypothetical protein n=1 Tax=Aestuariimicrobium sp. p3-SID1156 TaxID=2916038 RepID=UPI00223C44B1|nr:hypothetical protein [Aestuariimicrobium sp. p3-SID1156]MCT1459890.1 hypothetical protein [Aestuariimicrobium sp. p3-SID1156]
MTDLPPILCRECGCEIDDHIQPTCVDCDCELAPSDIARALLAAEPEPACPVHDLYGDHPLGAEDVTGCTCERKDRP